MELALIVFALVFYFLPFIVALSRGHKNSVGILILNASFGWTFLGWIIALIWAVVSK